MPRRLLFVTQQLPWPTDSGGNIRTFHMVAALARRFELVLASTTDGSARAEEGRAVLADLCAELVLVPDVKRRGAAGRALDVARSLVAGEPAVLVHNRNAALAAAVAERAPTCAAVHLNHLDTTGYVDLAARPAVIDTHNVLHQYYARRAEHEPSVAARWACRREARLLRDIELAHFRRVARVVVCSAEERTSLRALDATLPLEVVPNGVDCAYFTRADRASAPPDLVFVGDMAYGPNADGAEWFAREVLPLVREREPAARLVVVGKNPPRALQALAAEHVDIVVTGFVADVREPARAARAAVVPLRYGSGTRLKVLEAFALGLPVASTRVGAEGIEATDGEHLLLADEPRTLAEACLRLLEDAPLATRLGTAARRLVEARYDWTALGERMATIHASLA